MVVEQGSDETHWHAVYTEHLPKVYNFFRYRLGILDIATAEDLTSTTFEKAWRHRNQYRRDQAAFTTWLFTIARNVANDYHRTSQTTLPLDAARHIHAKENIDDVVAEHDAATRLNRLLAELPDRERELIALRYGAELTNRAIAASLKLSEANVAQILHRVLARLKQDPRIQDGR